MGPDGLRWAEVAQVGSDQLGWVQVGDRLGGVRMGSDWFRFLQMRSNWLGSAWMVSGGLGWVQIGSERLGWAQIGTGWFR